MKEFNFEIVENIRGTRILYVSVEAESLEEAEKMVYNDNYDEIDCDVEYDTYGEKSIDLVEENEIED